MPRPRWNHNLHYHRTILDALPDGARTALDVGCGEGILTRQLAERVPTVTGIDLDRPSIALARATSAPSVRYEVRDVMAPSPAPEQYDVVASVAMLHHVDAVEGLRRLSSLVAPGGLLAVIGLARRELPYDLPRELAAAVANRVLLARRSYWEHSAPMVWPPPETYRSMRRIAALELPGSSFHRHLLWRYSLLWRSPPG